MTTDTTTTTTVAPAADVLHVLEGIDLKGSPNTAEDVMKAQIAYAIRQQHPQARPEAMRPGTIALVGSGPSLTTTLPTLRDMAFAGTPVVSLNGAYHYLIERNLRPSAQVVLDARPSTARFVTPVVPRCKYFIASQCHADVWAAVKDRPDTFIFHAVAPNNPERSVLDDYYGPNQWMPVSGGTTVFSRALMLFRQGGYVRFEVFGVDSCWLDGQHHALDQPENDGDGHLTATVHPSGSPHLARSFAVSSWHLKQLEDLLQIVRVNGSQFQLAFHGDGLLAYAMQSFALAGDVETTVSTSHAE